MTVSEKDFNAPSGQKIKCINGDPPQSDLGSEVPKPPRPEARPRKDRGRLHAARNSVLSRGLLEALQQRGENLRALRHMECELRASLKPTGPLGRLLFDRLWASVLRLILVARVEQVGLALTENSAKKPVSVPSLRESSASILELVAAEEADATDHQGAEILPAGVFRNLALIARYDRAAGREFYRTLSLLLIMRNQGESGLESWALATVGINS